MTTLLIGLLRRDLKSQELSDTDLSFWSRDKSLFSTRSGVVIPGVSNRPTAELDVFAWKGGIAYHLRAFPSTDTSRIFKHGSASAQRAAVTTDLREQLRKHVTEDALATDDLISWLLTNKELCNVVPKAPWRVEYSANTLWDLSAVADSAAGGLFIEISRARQIECRLDRELLHDEAEWEQAVSPMILTALLPRRRSRRHIT